MTDKTRTKLNNYENNKAREVLGIVYLALAIFLAIAYYIPSVSSGPLGTVFVGLGKGLLGAVAYVIPILFFILSLSTFLASFFKHKKIKFRNVFFILILVAALIQAITIRPQVISKLTYDSQGNQSALQSIQVLWQIGKDPAQIAVVNAGTPGGVIGGTIALGLQRIAGFSGAIIILICAIISEAIILGNLSISKILITLIAGIYALISAIVNFFRNLNNKILEANERRQAENKKVSAQKAKALEAKREKILAAKKQQEEQDIPIYNYSGDETVLDNPQEVKSFDLESRDENKDRGQYEVPDFIIPKSGETETSQDFNDFVLSSDESADRERDYQESNADDFILSTDTQREEPEAEEKVSNIEAKDKAKAETKAPQQAKTLDQEKLEKAKVKAKAQETSAEDKQELDEARKVQEKPYVYPPLTLLKPRPVKKSSSTAKHVQKLAKLLERTLNSFGVDAKVVHITTGPSITRFEVRPGPGVKISKIVNLSDDIALSLAAKSIRIEAPIPGKSAVGIEIPNEQTALVGLRSLIEDEKYQNREEDLLVPLGRDIPGRPIHCDLHKMPHLLIAGATGSGKSMSINTIILSLLYRNSPKELRLLLIDPKVVELSVYNGIPHLLAPVVTDPAKAANTLNWLVQEMERRYELFAEHKARDMASYNAMAEKEEDAEVLPYIVLIIDELSDLMQTAPKEVENAISRLTAMARAAGIHLIIATQRPSVDVITGVIKANIPSRLAFAVSSQVDSRTILDQSGAEKLLGKGDMLFYPQSAAKPIRGQGAFVSDGEVENVISFLKAQDLKTQDADIAKKIVNTRPEGESTDEDDELDELFEDAVDIVVDNSYASISLLQRRLSIGYPRAARIVDSMADKGYIGPHNGSKPRDVYLSPEEWALIKAGAYDEVDKEFGGNEDAGSQSD